MLTWKSKLKIVVFNFLFLWNNILHSTWQALNFLDATSKEDMKMKKIPLSAKLNDGE